MQTNGVNIIMKKTLLLVSSITYAMKGKELLRRKGFKAYIERIPRGLQNSGCGYCIYVNGDTDAAERVLRASGIRVNGRYERAEEEE